MSRGPDGSKFCLISVVEQLPLLLETHKYHDLTENWREMKVVLCLFFHVSSGGGWWHTLLSVLSDPPNCHLKSRQRSPWVAVIVLHQVNRMLVYASSP